MSAPAIPAAPRRRPRSFMFVRESTWVAMLLVIPAICVLVAPLYMGDTLWLLPGIALTLLVVWQGVAASRTVPWIPGAVGLIACLQLIVMPWLAYHVPPTFAKFQMVVPPWDYMRFAVPAVATLVAGMWLPLLRRREAPARRAELGLSPVLRRTSEYMVWGGIVLRLIAVPLAPLSLRYALLLVGYFSYVGALALILARSPGWIWRAGAAFGVEILQSSSAGMFHEMLLWGMYLGLTIAYAYRVRMRTTLTVGLVGFLAIFALNGLKQDYRAELREVPLDETQRLGLFFGSLGERMAHPGDLLSGPQLSYNVTRLNQGWIVARVLAYVPSGEPFARGETIVAAARDALVPRILDPGKYEAGGHGIFERFTGLSLSENTSMGLGLSGEMYANFGYGGGLAALFVAGILIGLLFRVFLRWSRDSVLWWAWAPFVFLNVTQAETGVSEALNHVVKASIVMVVAISVLPGWSVLRRWRGLSRRGARRPAAPPVPPAAHAAGPEGA